MSEAIQLGPFELGQRIGKGGMGSVYRARHTVTGVDVALKILPHGGDEAARRRFHREVQAQAELTHPGVVYLFEYGTVEAEAARASDELVAGSPYVAMELADAGTLLDQRPLEGWSQVRAILLQVLDALGFAHARDVIHRDLKPENFLVFEDEWSTDEAAVTIKLADFGLAHPFEDEQDRDLESLRTAAGTPFYMPPEQGRGNWREYGPWTDLYALGCITWELVCGHPPFPGNNPLAVILQHEDGDRPPLEPQFPVPDDLEAWIHRAMAVDPNDRFRRAADAARALPALPRTRPKVDGNTGETAPPTETTSAPDGGAARTRTLSGDLAPTLAPTLAETALLDPTASVAETLPVDEAPDAGLRDPSAAPPSGGDAATAPSFPSTWQQTSTDAVPAPLVGTGLGLFGLREVPFVDRDSERDTIWQALREVVEQNAFRVVLLAGDAGTGKSRLADWITTRAHELGAGHPLQAVHTPGGGGRAEGLAGMVRRTFHTWKLSRSKAYDHLYHQLPALDDEDSLREADARALTELLYPTDEEADSVDGPPYHFSSPDQRHALMRRLLARFGQRRAPVVWLDDLQWGIDATGLLQHLTSTVSETPPALILGTIRSDLLADHPRVREQLAVIADDERCRRLDLSALDGADQRELLERLLPLDDEVADVLASRTEGNPLFAVQLLGHWIERGTIAMRPEGFGLDDTREVAVPEDIHALWMERLDRLVGMFPAVWAADAVASLELAAALGREVDGDEWRAVCEEADADPPADLVDAMVDRGLANRTREGWAFAHGLLVETLEQRSRDSDRWRDHHHHCARALERLYREEPKKSAAPVADHWIAAGELERALDPLLDEFHRLSEYGDLAGQHRVLERRQRLLGRLAIDPDDPRRIENDLELAYLKRNRGEGVEENLDQIRSALERAKAIGHDELQRRALISVSGCYKWMSAYDEAKYYAEQSLEIACRTDATNGEGEAHKVLGWIAYARGQLDRARHHFETARDKFDAAGDEYEKLRVLRGLITPGGADDSSDDIRERGQRFRRMAREHGYRKLEANFLNLLGEVARFRGNASQARTLYRRYAESLRELGQPYDLVSCTLNLAQVDLMEGDFERAADRLGPAEQRIEEMGLDEKQHLTALIRLDIAAGRGDWGEFDRRFSPYTDGWPDEARLIVDHPWLLEMTGDHAADAGETERARHVWQLARRLWQRLETEDATARLASKHTDLD